MVFRFTHKMERRRLPAREAFAAAENSRDGAVARSSHPIRLDDNRIKTHFDG
jgi:hypothetical protein